jgi:hypothetical protein
MLSGFSRLFKLTGFVVAVLLAVSPVPLLILLAGAMQALTVG